jgi:hypothetical protein
MGCDALDHLVIHHDSVCWRNNLITPLSHIEPFIEDYQAMRLSAVCLYLESQGITPTQESFAQYKQQLDWMLYEPQSRRYLFLFSLERLPHAFVFALHEKNLADLEQEIHQCQMQVPGGKYEYSKHVICNKEAYIEAKERIVLNTLPHFGLNADLVGSCDHARATEAIHHILERAIHVDVLPSRKAHEDRLLAPFLFQLTLERARRGNYIHYERGGHD